MSNPGTIETLVRILGDALSPLAERLQGDGAEEVIEQLGLRLPTGSLTSANVTQGLQASASACSQLPQAVAQLVAAISGGDNAAMINAAATLAQRVIQAGTAFTQLGVALDNVIQGAAGLTPAQTARLRAAAEAIPERLLHLALISYLEDKQPAVKGALNIAGLFDDTPIPGDPADPSLPPHHLKRIRFDRLGPLVSDPIQHLKDLYGFGNADFDGLELFRRVKAMVDRPDAEAILITAPGQPAALEAFVFRLAVAPGAIPGLRIRVRMPAERDFDVSLPLGGPWSATTSAQARFETGIEFLLHPQTGLHIEAPAAAAKVALTVGLKAENADGSPMILIGQAGGSRVELLRFASRLPLQISASTGSPSPSVKLAFEVELKQGKIVIDGSQADGFIGTILGGIKVESGFELGAVYDPDKGLRFNGSATVQLAIPTHLSLGPITIETLYLIGGFKDGAIPIEFSADLGAQLGPLSASVGRMGAAAKLTFPKKGGNAGPLQMDVAFKPPNGVGLSIDLAVVKGGGYLYFDFEKEEYAGALELSVMSIITVKAIGLITTRMPDGSKGFSLLIIISAEFTGIQLGFGFTLNGLGGLLGLNRTMQLEEIAKGVRTGGINSIMFPKDIVANAPRIISDLRLYFPPQEGRFLIGLMAKIGWGTPSLATLSLGLIVEIPPGKVAILGILKVALPAEEAPLIVIQVNFIGAIEPDKERLWFFAELFESRVLFISIEGGMGLLVAWGENANFVLLVGGFHPRFNPPPLPFPVPKRVALDILNTPVSRIRVEGYFAVTSNTVQFGARVELRLGFDEIGIFGHVAFDALFQFSPFYFIIEISGSVELKVFGLGLFSIRLEFSLEGPVPWRAKGSGTLSLLFFDISADFDITWGDKEDTTLEPIAVVPLLETEFNKKENWRAELPKGSDLLVSLRPIEETAGLVMHPVGILVVSQRAVPLDLDIAKVGNKKVSDARHFRVKSTTAGLGKKGDRKEQFAMGQFLDLSNADKLSRKSYERQNSGLELSAVGRQTVSSRAVKRIVRYEMIVIDSKYKRKVFNFFAFAGTLFNHFLRGNAAAKSPLSQATQKLFVPFDEKVKVQQEGYVVATNFDNKPFNASKMFFDSEATAHDFMRAQTFTNPDLGEVLHVIPAHEAVTN
jgi:hypothetical protein